MGQQTPKAPVIVTPGDPAGIGAEISLKAAANGETGFCLMEDPDRLAAIATSLELNVSIVPLSSLSEVPAAKGTLAVMPISWPVEPIAGRPDPANAEVIINSIALASRLAQTGEASAITTNPIAKSVLMEAGFEHPGHTEFLGTLCSPRSGAPAMMLACDQLRVVPVTVHIALRDVPDQLTSEDIYDKGVLLAETLSKHFGCQTPRIAVCGLNPHAGEDGRFGHEDTTIIAPAVARLRSTGIDARGPLSADTLFHTAARSGYDAVLGMYHDQVLIPIKTLDFDGGVNVTLGLDFIRTSPDHGTAFDIAGTGKARPDSLIAAIRMAKNMSQSDVKNSAG